MKDHITQNKPLLITVFLLAAFIVAAVVALWLRNDNQSENPTVAIDDVVVTVEVADTPSARTTGLSEHSSLGESEGMWFIFDEPGQRYFHMKDMDFPIDIIWLDEDRQIVDITHEISPETYPDRFTSETPAQYVLEVNAGFARENDISAGDQAVVSGR